MSDKRVEKKPAFIVLEFGIHEARLLVKQFNYLPHMSLPKNTPEEHRDSVGTMCERSEAVSCYMWGIASARNASQ
ncbi:MAG: hypothetical protein EHM81_12660 [Chloroflexi bacterium]|nr:MAG: hypothetical protein EHM81_12660 [Chloroflexota bacterium]